MAFQRILVATDFSDDARAAAELALTIADRDGAELLLLHISELPDYAFMAIEPIFLPQKLWEQLWERESRQIRTKLDELQTHLQDRSSGAAKITGKYRRAKVIEELHGAADELGCDLMVIGSQGENASVRYLFGGHAPKLARDAPCPVLLVRSSAPPRLPEHALVAIDYSKFSKPTALLAKKLLANSGRVTCYHVWQQPPLFAVEPYPEFSHVVESARAAEARRMEGFVGSLDACCETHAVDIGRPARRILEFAHERDADIIVLGSHGRSGIERIVGTVADRVLRHADIPVLLLPERALEKSRRATTTPLRSASAP